MYAWPAHDWPGNVRELEHTLQRAQVLAHTRGVIHGERGGARLLHLKPTTLRSRLQKLGLLQTQGRRCSTP